MRIDSAIKVVTKPARAAPGALVEHLALAQKTRRQQHRRHLAAGRAGQRIFDLERPDNNTKIRSARSPLT